MKKFIAPALLAAVLAGCATQPTTGVPINGPDVEVLNRIAQHAQQASLSMQRMAALKGAGAGLKIGEDEVPAGLEMPISINWSGPVESLVKKIAEMTGYDYEAPIGSKPATPVLVSVSVNAVPAFGILADAGAQTGSAADIVIRPDSRKIFVKYPPTVRSGGYVSNQK
jgi:defect-in-organelle-trafficking protein DotD